MEERSDLKIYTSFVSPTTLREFTKNDLLPIFIIRNIESSELIGKYSGTAIHLRELAPSTELFRKKRDSIITIEEFKKLYSVEISKINLKDIVKKLELLATCSQAKGIVLLGYGSSCSKCHRSILGDILNSSDLLNNKVQEILI